VIFIFFSTRFIYDIKFKKKLNIKDKRDCLGLF